jgi:hypothetical protein
MAEKALPISKGMEPGPMRVFPIVISTILLRSGSPAITAIKAEVSIIISTITSGKPVLDNCTIEKAFVKTNGIIAALPRKYYG